MGTKVATLILLSAPNQRQAGVHINQVSAHPRQPEFGLQEAVDIESAMAGVETEHAWNNRNVESQGLVAGSSPADTKTGGIMRDIKFRAYHKQENRFYYFDIETCTQTVYVGFYHPITGEKDCELDDYSLYSEKQLYTGLKDKNDTEGYFDDLVKWGYSTYQIMWNCEEGVAQLIKCSGDEVRSKLPIKELANGEVIGNIHENPKILKGGQ